MVPDILKGYVELVYDLNNNPSFRVVEPLLYQSRYYDRSAQSLMLSVLTADERPFVLSTPRLETDSLYHLRIPFDDERVDELLFDGGRWSALAPEAPDAVRSMGRG